jgi:predicted glycoside hydrolase/deacetylase ChbG (UPF0249 family)
MAARLLIVNADDFGATPGVNRGILEAHLRGVVTSTSLMVDAPASVEAARLGRSAPGLGLGLHVDLQGVAGAWRGEESLLDELARQRQRFVELVGRPPSHVDSHRDVHRAPDLLPAFLALARGLRVPLRGHSAVRCLAKFYGQWAGVSHPEQLSVESLARLLESGAGEGVTELVCHPGYCDAQLASSYRREREIEVTTLCDPRARDVLRGLGIELTNHDALARPVSSPR